MLTWAVCRLFYKMDLIMPFGLFAAIIGDVAIVYWIAQIFIN